jgi:DNA-binding MarR family transcriptional regulator
MPVTPSRSKARRGGARAASQPPRKNNDLPRRLSRVWTALQPVILNHLAIEGLAGVVQPGMGHVLFALVEEDGLIIRDIARRAQVSHVAVLQTVEKLENAGLVKRRASSADGRATQVWLTSAAQALRPQLRRINERNIACIEEIIGRDGATLLNGLLGRLLDGLRRRSSPPNENQS